MQEGAPFPLLPVRALGVDFGEARIGLALSDETGTLATPLETIRRRPGKRPPFKAMEEVARRCGVEAIVFGLPLELSGEDSEWSHEVRAVAAKFGERLGLPVHLVDERMSSVRAERMVRSSGLPLHKREEKGRVDGAAAAILLQEWLDRRRRVP
ncbi:MAG: Holliday junction resolvase RuvX [Gemmatimonadota bacterium]